MTHATKASPTAYWSDGGLVIDTTVADLAGWLVSEYVPTPVLSPWNGGSGFGAKDKEQVDSVYKLAMSLGATCEGPPGQRSPQFYAAYFRDPDGNKLNAFVMG